MKSDFGKWIRFQVHNRQLINFWEDVYFGNKSRALFHLDRRLQFVIPEKIEMQVGKIVWNFCFQSVTTQTQIQPM